jgi:hypothetical protein
MRQSFFRGMRSRLTSTTAMPDRALLQEAPLVPRRGRDRGRQVRPCCGLRPQAPDSRLSVPLREPAKSPHSRRLLSPAGITRISAPRNASARSERKLARSWSPKATYFSRRSGCRVPVTLRYPTSLARSPGPRFGPGHRFRGAGAARGATLIRAANREAGARSATDAWERGRARRRPA